MTWNPEQYLKFAEPRLRPAIDLLSRIDSDNPQRVFDLGCGAGNVTKFIKARWPESQVTGVDDSAAMLASAEKAVEGVAWQQQSLAHWRVEDGALADVIYSNAALHWLHDHALLFPRLMTQLAPGGVLAVQMPRNFESPSHTLIAETVRSGPWQARLEVLLKAAPVSAPAFYYDLLRPLASSLDIWESEYLQVLEGEDPVKEWTKGTWLKQFLDALPTDAAAERFEADYAARLRAAYPPRADGKTLFPFRRLFIIAKR
ncbi:MAG: methyltransferase domain-containing protein [Burkholderiales bacterium]|nr:methyltransferase domain-containing protein [Burkholderiales bacterium]